MDEIIDVADVVLDLGLEGPIARIVQVLGVLAVLAGIVLLVVESVALWVSAVCIVGGIVAVVVPQLLLWAIEAFA